MLLIRRMWLAPALCITFIIYYFFYSSLRNHAYEKIAQSKTNAPHLVPRPATYPVTSFIPLPSGPAKVIPPIQYDFQSTPETPDAKKVRQQRQAAVKEAFLHSWNGYKLHAFGKDEIAPVSGSWRDSFGGWGATMVDSMTTLWIMGLEKDFEMCVEAVTRIDFTTNTEGTLNVFETTIRYLGGLLSAYDISNGKYPGLLDKARELGDLLYMAFDTSNRMPVTRWEWRKTAEGLPIEPSQNTLLAELASLTLEFTRLSQLTFESKYFDAVQRITNHMGVAQPKTSIPGLWPTIVDARNLHFDYNHFTFGGMADSAYEYLPKEYLLLGGLDQQYQKMYEAAIDAAKKHLLYRPMTPDGQNILFSGNAVIQDGRVSTEPQGQHLTCFVGGMIGIGARIFKRPEEISIARKLVDGCVWAYNQMPSGLMPEVFHVVPCHVGVDTPAGTDCAWDDEKWYSEIDARHGLTEQTASMQPIERGKYWAEHKALFRGFTNHPDNRYILRPEAIESVFILYRITGDTELMDSAWTMFQSIEKATRTQFAHAGVYDVRESKPIQSDRMESFWLGETLKYFWLMFSETDQVSLDDWVFTTEAHPLRRPKPGQILR